MVTERGGGSAGGTYSILDGDRLKIAVMGKFILFSQDVNTSELAPYPCLSELSGRLSGHFPVAASRRRLSDTSGLAPSGTSFDHVRVTARQTITLIDEYQNNTAETLYYQ